MYAIIYEGSIDHKLSKSFFIFIRNKNIVYYFEYIISACNNLQSENSSLCKKTEVICDTLLGTPDIAF